MKTRSCPGNVALLPFQNFDRFFEETFGALQPLSASFRQREPDALLPRTDVWEGKDTFELKVELPGVARDALQIEVKDRTLTISAEVKKPAESEEGEATTTRRYQRTIQLPPNIEIDRIEAKITDGLLTVNLPKAAEAKERTIEIK